MTRDWTVDSWWPYDSAGRRRARALWRTASAVARIRSTRPSVLPMYWWDGHPNFGDALTPWILARRGIVALHTPLSRARAAGVGSIIDQLDDDFAGVIWGSGLLHDVERRLPVAEVLAVRGPLTRDRLGLDGDIALGDPGLLIGRDVRRHTPRWQLGVVVHGMHYADEGLLRLGRLGAVHAIAVRSTPSVVMSQIARCDAILTTSLHGLVVADALGIPAAWTRREPRLWGDDFKFRDYEAVVSPGRSREILVEETTGREDIVRLCGLPDGRALEQAVAALEATVRRLPTTSHAIWAEHLDRKRAR